MYSPLSQDEEPLLTDTKTEQSGSRTLSPNFLNRKITNIRSVSDLIFIISLDQYIELLASYHFIVTGTAGGSCCYCWSSC